MIRLLHQDETLFVLHKPSGMTVYREEGSRASANVVEEMQELYGEKLHPVHRIDRDTCGVLLLARNGRWARLLQEQFAKGLVTKTYHALVLKRPAREGRIETQLKTKGVLEKAITDLKILKVSQVSGAEFSLLELRPITGKFHQLRKQCRELDAPMVGDAEYGSAEINQRWAADRTMLCARQIEFAHPRSKKPLRFSTEPDADFQECARKLCLL